MKRYALYIDIGMGKKIYWNRILNAWFNSWANASPYTEEEVEMFKDRACTPWDIKAEEVDEW